MSELPEKLRPFESLFRPEDYSLLTTAQPEQTLFLEQALPPESWPARARRVGRHAMAKIVRSPRTRSYGLGFGLGSAAIATGIAVAFFTANNTADTAQLPSKSPQEVHTPAASGKPNTNTKPEHMVPIAKPSDIPVSLWPAASSWEPAPTTQSSASTTPPSSPRAPKPTQPSKPAPTWSTMLPTVSQSPSNTEAPSVPPTDEPTSSPEPIDTASTEAWPETPPTALSPSPGD